MSDEQQITRLRYYEPLSCDFIVVLGSLAFVGVSMWILCILATLFALICARYNDIWES